MVSEPSFWIAQRQWSDMPKENNSFLKGYVIDILMISLSWFRLAVNL